MDQITADHAAFRATVTDLERAATRLHAERDRAARSVEELLGTWSGTVATAYAQGWDAWRAGSDQVLAALEAMARLLAAADADLGGSDQAAGSALDRLAGRLG